MTERSHKSRGVFKIEIIVLLISIIVWKGKAANVLYVAPSPAISHYQMLEPLMLILAQRGHNITVLSHFPQKEKIVNYSDVSLKELYVVPTMNFTPTSFLEDSFGLFPYGKEFCEHFAASNVIQGFIKADYKFDLIFIEAFHTDCLLGFVAKFKAPFIVFSAMSLPVWQSDWIYNPAETNYLADVLCRLAGKMNFYERLQNFGCHLIFRGLNWWHNRNPPVEVARKHFQVDVSNFDDLKRNVSFVFVNSFHGLTGVRPFLPNVLEIGGIHLKPSTPLPHNIATFLDESIGVIVISMGSIVQSHTLTPTIKSEFLSVFSKLKERVLWKWEENFSDKPKNLMTVPWLPQSDVLGHSKVKLFISHGGIHGLYEAIYNGVPIIGIPLFGDQKGNLKALELKGVAVVIEFADLNGKTLSSAINNLLRNDSYRKNAQMLSKIFRDQPQTPLDKAVFWTEYVLRHGGAPHFRSGASELSWLQYTLIDVLFLCVSFLVLLIAVFYHSLKILRII